MPELPTLDAALVCVGLALLYLHNPFSRWLVIPIKPFTCLYCLSWWMGVLWALWFQTLEAAFVPVICLVVAYPILQIAEAVKLLSDTPESE